MSNLFFYIQNISPLWSSIFACVAGVMLCKMRIYASNYQPFFQDALEKEMEVHRESQQKQIAKLRDEIQENESLVAELKE